MNRFFYYLPFSGIVETLMYSPFVEVYPEYHRVFVQPPIANGQSHHER